MPNLMKAKSLINNRVRNSEGAVARPYTVAGGRASSRLAVPACNARIVELRTRIRCKRVGDTNEDENAHQNKDAQEVCRVIVSGFRKGRSQEPRVVANVQRIRPSEPAAGLWCCTPASQFLRCKALTSLSWS